MASIFFISLPWFSFVHAKNNMNIEDKKIEDTRVEPTERTTHPAWVWLAVVLALVAWAVLAWSNGYVAMVVAAAAMAVGFVGTRHNSVAMKRLAVTAIIASTVLLVVVAAYLVVLKIGLK